MSTELSKTFTQFTETAPVLMYAVDVNLNYTYINPFFCEVHSVSRHEAIGLSIKDVIGEEGFNSNLEHYKKVLQGETVKYKSFFIKKDGGSHHYYAIYEPLLHREVIVGFTGIVIDITAEKELEFLSSTDGLTKLYNRRKFEADFQKLIERDSNDKYGLILIDIDRFKAINDDFGHGTGDKALVGLSGLFKSCIKGKRNVYRIGGEEFAILIPDPLSKDELYNLADSVRREVEETKILQRRLFTISVGVTSFIQEEDQKRVLKRADVALYTSKENGRNQTHMLC